jgi:hypothetical protein
MRRNQTHEGEFMVRHLLIMLSGLVLLIGCARAPESQGVDEGVSADAAPALESDVVRPKFRLDSNVSFAAASVGTYPTSHDAVYAHIDENLEQHIAEIQR